MSNSAISRRYFAYLTVHKTRGGSRRSRPAKPTAFEAALNTAPERPAVEARAAVELETPRAPLAASWFRYGRYAQLPGMSLERERHVSPLRKMITPAGAFVKGFSLRSCHKSRDLISLMIAAMRGGRAPCSSMYWSRKA
jgi:hypothetical protein